MNKFVVLISPDAIKQEILLKIKALAAFELYPGVFFVKSEKTAKQLYTELLPSNTQNIKMVVFNLNDKDYWGYADKAFWPWISSSE